MSFVHGKTVQKYYSVREKINYYKKVKSGKIEASEATKARADKRLEELMKINDQSYAEPKMIVTDDKHFGNPISKPRAAVVVDEGKNGRIRVAPLQETRTKTVVLDNDIGRQISDTGDGHVRWLDRCDVYETKYIENLVELTERDKRKISKIFKKKRP